MKYASSTVALLLAFVLVGQGCPTGRTDTTVVPQEPETPVERVADKKAFGKLPSPGAPSGQEALVSDDASALGAGGLARPAVAPSAEVGMKASTDMAVIGRPIPGPYPSPGIVTYDLDATLPSWPADGAVLRMRDISIPSAARVVTDVGVPGQALGDDPKIHNINVSWRDTDGMQWTYDAMNHMISFWKEMATKADEATRPPDIDDADLVGIADAFLAKKGFGNVPRGPGVVEKPWGEDLMRCAEPFLSEPDAGSAGSDASRTVTAEPAVAPAPDETVSSMPRCWWPSYQANVLYEGTRDGKRIQDAGGWPWRAANVSIEMKSKTVTGGSIYLARDVDSSQYPLISKEEAEKRLRSGGRNPLWSWEGGTVKVHLKTVDVVWMRYDAWRDGMNETFLLPALAASGDATYPDGRTDEYRTIIPLVTDDAFEDAAPPVEIMPMKAE
ncbi:hypothetical protein L0Y59_00690 [Candidatus Uhrbacteria bacterium]|nr:hypothetical protein [Candidatus Uhrbacteria bacterium]